MDHINKLDVFISDKHVGTLAMYKDSVAAFQYSDGWINSGFAIDPINLPLDNKIYIPEYRPFNGLFGVFNDSLPDGWGMLVLDRFLSKHKIHIDQLNPLDKLSIVGNSGMGALEYRPVNEILKSKSYLSLDQIAEESLKIFEFKSSENLDEIYNAGGSSGGARPKAFIEIDGKDWIVKFPCSQDVKYISQMEFDYCSCAKECGIQVPEISLLPSKKYIHFFAVKRFDRIHSDDGQVNKVHKISASSLLNTSHRVPSMDYGNLMAATWHIAKDINEVKKIYKLMCFNVFAHNRDDHSNNFSFLFHDNKWHVSPAYDLTYSNSLNGEHATTINGEGKNPTLEDILSVVQNFDLDETWCYNTITNIKNLVEDYLGKYLK